MAIHLAIIHIFLLAITLGGSFAQKVGVGISLSGDREMMSSSRKELKTKEMNQNKMILMDRPQISKSIDPSQVVQLSWQPRSGCSYIKAFCRTRSVTTWGQNCIKDQGKDFCMDFSSQRIWPIYKVLRFGPEDSEKHSNYFHTNSPEQLGKPLLATVILSLSNVSQGGQILFPESESKMWSDCTRSSNILRPSRGNAILVFNQHLNATPDRSSLLEGGMWCATKFFYLKSISSEKNLSRFNDPDCADEDKNCPLWAAIGECQRNPVFMIGSPDYYGACRKSCNSC